MKPFHQRSRGLFISVMTLMMLAGGCSDWGLEEEDDVESTYFWSPVVKIEKGDGKATVVLINPMPFTNYVPPGPSNPEYFNIWVSDDSVNFSLFRKVGIKTTSVEIDNLTNDEPYYFYVTSHKKDKVEQSGTLMTIPSREPEMVAYLPEFGESLQRLSTSYDQNYISYTIHHSLYVAPSASGSSVSLGQYAYGATWSATTNQMVYVASKLEQNTVYPFQIQLLDPASQAITTLFEVQYHDFYATGPSFTPDGEQVVFLSSEGNTTKYIYDFWSLDPVSKERKRLTNFEADGFFPQTNYDWASSAEEIYLDGSFDQSKAPDIFRMSLSDNKFTPVIRSDWSEVIPTLSPDNSELAFISDRSGEEELWIYNLTSKTYRQITGESTYQFDSRYTNLQWISGKELLITVYKGDRAEAIRIEVD